MRTGTPVPRSHSYSLNSLSSMRDSARQVLSSSTKLLSIRRRHMTHKQLRIVLTLALVAAFAIADSSHTPSAPQQPPQASALSQDLPKPYLPGLGDFMGRIQTDHAKL